MNNKVALESLAMDLKRVALGYHRNSLVLAEKFYQEALKRKNEIDATALKPYIKAILEDIEVLTSKESNTIAEEAMLFSILIQNYTRISW